MNLLQRRNSIDMTLGERLNKIIEEQNISKAEFAKRVGITRNYIYILTGNSRPGTERNKDISPMLAKVIAMEFGYDENWVLKGDN
ncbi:MAG: helix-turn-helix transcriptional regulator [Ruminococcaceae bacterium]|nr:helix-turn-helix transcriptional regulator [Oscillospiraceae bacterium]